PATKKLDHTASKVVKSNTKTDSGNIGNHTERPYMAVKTNLAYDIFAVMNASFEMQFARHFSAELPVYWSLWDWKSTSGLRTAAIQPGVKYHFSQPGTGHAVGLDMGIAWYNMRHDQRRYQDCGRPMLGASVNYSYTLGLGRGWSMEFAIGAGYVNTRYNTYYNIDNGALIDTRQRNYFGPTRVGVSLVYNLAK
ncbi:MAG: DUF3575 domain-containing protein, partial [Muribaculaceae bacterium]|nr:DUF3575 domain-containing protein [Muribaculaceae bacterium]